MPIPALPFDEAIAWLRARVPMGDEEFAALDARAKHRAFALAGVAQASVAGDVWRALERHLQQGPDVDAFKREFAPRLAALWGVTEGKAGARLGLVAHNALQSSYNAGRWAQSTEGIAPKVFPYLQFLAVRDFRTSPICRALDGLILPVGDPRWRKRVPPCHHYCRSTFRSARKETVDAQGGPHEGELPKAGVADDGFGEIPSLTSWAAPVPVLPPPLAKVYKAKPPPPPMPAPVAAPKPAAPPPKPAPVVPLEPPPSLPPVAPPAPAPPPPARPVPFASLPAMSDAALRTLQAHEQPPDGLSATAYRAANGAELAALPLAEQQAITAFTHGYDWAIRELDKGRDPGELAEAVDRFRAGSKVRPPDANGAEHVRLAQQYRAAIYAAMPKLAPRQATIYRGMDRVPAAALGEGLLSRDVIEFSALSSASWRARIALAFAGSESDPPEGTFKVLLRLRTRTAPGIEQISAFRGEAELLVPRGARYRITHRQRLDREGSRFLIVDAEEIDPTPPPAALRARLGAAPAAVPPPYDAEDRAARFVTRARRWRPEVTPDGAVRLP